MDPAPSKTAPPRQRRFTVEEYHRMGAAGIFSEDDRVELLDGHICTMSPIGSDHASCVDRLTRLFVLRVGDAATVRVQNPIQLDLHSEPEPDLALVTPNDEIYQARHPRPNETLLVIEVADTSMTLDRDVKLPLYARAALPEVWIVALETDRVHVYRTPEADRYGEHEAYGPDSEVTVSTLPSVEPVPVDRILGA